MKRFIGYIMLVLVPVVVFWSLDCIVNRHLYAQTVTQDLISGRFDGICPICKKEAKTSTVQVGYSTGTLLANMPYYDEKGVLRGTEDPNTYTTRYRCSRGHEFLQTCGSSKCWVTITKTTEDAPIARSEGVNISGTATISSRVGFASTGTLGHQVFSYRCPEPEKYQFECLVKLMVELDNLKDSHVKRVFKKYDVWVGK